MNHSLKNKNKKGFCPNYWDKSLNFCGTTRFDDYNHPLNLHTTICTPLITDRAPVDAYSRIFRFQAALARPFSKFYATAFTPASGSLIHPSLLTFLAPRFLGLKFVIILRLDTQFVNLFSKNFLFAFLRTGKPTFIFPFSLDKWRKYDTLKLYFWKLFYKRFSIRRSVVYAAAGYDRPGRNRV